MNCSELGSLKFRTGPGRNSSKNAPTEGKRGRTQEELCGHRSIFLEILQRFAQLEEPDKKLPSGSSKKPAPNASKQLGSVVATGLLPEIPEGRTQSQQKGRIARILDLETLRLRFLGNYWFKPPNSRARKATPRIMGEPKKKMVR